MSAHYAMCKYDDATGSYIPLEVRPITDKLKKDDPLYQEGFRSGATRRDAEIAELQRKLANEQARDIHSCHPNCTREGCVNRRLRAELVKALAACKAKDEALESCGYADDSTDPEMCGPYYDAELVQQALAIQPDDAALKDKAMTTYEQPKDWIERHLVEDPGGLLACEPSGLNEELKLARQANEFQHQTIKKQAAQIATMRELLLLSKNGSNAAYQEAVQKALAIQPDDSALKAWLGEPVAEVDDSGVVIVCRYDYKPKDKFYSPKGLK